MAYFANKHKQLIPVVNGYNFGTNIVKSVKAQSMFTELFSPTQKQNLNPISVKLSELEPLLVSQRFAIN